MGGRANAEIGEYCFSAADWHYGPAMANIMPVLS